MEIEAARTIIDLNGLFKKKHQAQAIVHLM